MCWFCERYPVVGACSVCNKQTTTFNHLVGETKPLFVDPGVHVRVTGAPAEDEMADLTRRFDEYVLMVNNKSLPNDIRISHSFHCWELAGRIRMLSHWAKLPLKESFLLDLQAYLAEVALFTSNHYASRVDH